MLMSPTSPPPWVRHTGTEIAMEVMTHLAKLNGEIGQARLVKERQQSSAAKDAMGAMISAEAERLSTQEAVVSEMMKTF